VCPSRGARCWAPSRRGRLYLIASGKAISRPPRFATNVMRPITRGIPLSLRLVTEVVMTAMFLLIIRGSTDKRAPMFRPPSPSDWDYPHPPRQHPVTKTSVNPAPVPGWPCSRVRGCDSFGCSVGPHLGALIGRLSIVGSGKGSDSFRVPGRVSGAPSTPTRSDKARFGKEGLMDAGMSETMSRNVAHDRGTDHGPGIQDRAVWTPSNTAASPFRPPQIGGNLLHRPIPIGYANDVANLISWPSCWSSYRSAPGEVL
jgi:hypothetical protein